MRSQRDSLDVARSMYLSLVPVDLAIYMVLWRGYPFQKVPRHNKFVRTVGID
jgi:hypothetical protein